MTALSNSDYIPPHVAKAPSGWGPPHYRGFTITLRHTILGRTPQDEWSPRRRDHYLITHNTHRRQTPMPLAAFKPSILASKWSLIHTLDPVAIGIGCLNQLSLHLFHFTLTCKAFCKFCLNVVYYTVARTCIIVWWQQWYSPHDFHSFIHSFISIQP